MLLCATLTAVAAALLTLPATALRTAKAERMSIRETITISQRSTHEAFVAHLAKGSPPGRSTSSTSARTGYTDDRPHGGGPLQRLTARSDSGLAESSLARGCWRGAAALKTWRVVIAVGCLSVSAAGCSSSLPSSTSAKAQAVAPRPSAVNDLSLPGIGAKRGDWDASHTPNAAFNNGMVYGENPGLPSYLAANGAVYIEVSDLGTGRIQSYKLNMQAATRHQALDRIRQELPPDAKVAWDLRLNHCYRVAFASPTLESAGHYMAEVQLQFLKANAMTATRPRSFNEAWFQLDAVGSAPNPQINCGHRIRDSTVDLRAETLRPTGQAARYPVVKPSDK